MPHITFPVDRGVRESHRYQSYEVLVGSGYTEVTFDFNGDIGRAVGSGYIKNNTANEVEMSFNYTQDIDGSMGSVTLIANGTFSFDPTEIPIETLKLTSGLAIAVDIFVS